MRKIVQIGIIGSIAFFCLLLLPQQSMAQGLNHKAYSLFIFNFALFTEFPPSESNNEEVKFAVVGNSNIYNELAEMLPGRTINGKRCSVERVNSANELQGHDVVFLTSLKSGQLDEVLQATNTQPVLIITEHDGLIRKGAAISFLVTDDQKLSFELNETALRERNLRVSSKLKGFAYSQKGK